MNAHRLAEERSIAYHRAIGVRLRREPALLDQVRAHLEKKLTEGGRSARYYQQWRELLERPLDEILVSLVDESEGARALRQSSPFAGILPPDERWRIWREVKLRDEKAG